MISINDEQNELVHCKDTRIVCLAGAGAGKTFSIIQRLKSLIDDGEDISSILCLTFTRAAAFEMKRRFRTLVECHDTPEFRTFHAFCYNIIRQDIYVRSAIGYRDIPEICSDSKYRELYTEAKLQSGCKLSEKKLRNPDSLSLLDNYEYLSFIRSLKRLLRHNNYITFDILCNEVCRLFVENDSCVLKYKKKYKHIIVDEFQDTDETQFKFINSFDDSNILVVGDILQSLYAFRGATSDIMKRMIDDSDWTKIRLHKNYRSSRSICEYANENTDYANPEYRIALECTRSEIGTVDIDTDNSCYSHVVDDIRKLENNGDIAILCRSNSEVSEIKNLLKNAGIEYESSTNNLEYSNILKSVEDNEYFLSYSLLCLNEEDYARYIRLKHIEKIENPLLFLYDNFYNNVEALRKFMSKVFDIRNILRSKSSYISKCKDILDCLDFDIDIINQDLFSNYDVLSYCKSLLNSDKNCHIYVGTIHSSKGLEYDNVILINVNGKGFKLNSEDNHNIYYVGITRAKNYLKVYKYE